MRIGCLSVLAPPEPNKQPCIRKRCVCSVLPEHSAGMLSFGDFFVASWLCNDFGISIVAGSYAVVTEETENEEDGAGNEEPSKRMFPVKFPCHAPGQVGNDCGHHKKPWMNHGAKQTASPSISDIEQKVQR